MEDQLCSQNYQSGYGFLMRRVIGAIPDSGTVDKIKAAAQVKEIKGVEMIYPTHVNEDNIKEVKEICLEKDIKVISVNPNIWSDKEFQKGSLYFKQFFCKTKGY